MRILFTIVMTALFLSSGAQACDNCNAADTVRSNIIRAMKARSATQKNSELKQPTSQPESNQLDENFFSDKRREAPSRSYRRPRAVVEEY